MHWSQIKTNKRDQTINGISKFITVFVPHLSPVLEAANKSHEKATLSWLASHAFCEPADLSRISLASQPPTF